MVRRGALSLLVFITFSLVVIFRTRLIASVNPCVQVTPGITYVCMELNLKGIPSEIPNSTQNLDLSFNPLEVLYSNYFSLVPALRFLDITRCHITKIEDDAFAGLHSLSVLLLTGNPLQFLAPRAFQDLTSLQRLVLVETNLFLLDSLPIGHLMSLQELNLSNNYIDSLKLPKYFSQLIHLKRLILQSNKISSISSGDLDALPTHNLTLVLCRNNIKYIQPRSFKRVYLQELSLRSSFEDNAVMQVGLLNLTGLHVNSLVLGGHRNLRKAESFNKNLLDGLCHMELQKITLICTGDAFGRTDSLSACLNNISTVRFMHTYLKTVYFPKNNNIRHLECKDIRFYHVPFENLASLTELRVLRITDTNTLVEFNLRSEVNWTLKNLETLDLSDNNLYIDLRWLCLKERFSNLMVLNLSFNSLITLSTEVFGPTKLKYLDLQHSRLIGPGRLPTFLCLKTLIYLDISYTSIVITMECSFCGLDSLEVLKMAGNSFKDNQLANAFTNVTKLKILDISYCQLQHVSLSSFDLLHDLRELNISNNKLLDFYPESYMHLQALTILDFHSNQLITLTKKHLENLPSGLKKLDLSQNLFDCSCDRLYFLRWGQEHKDLFINAEMMKCHSPSHLKGTQLMHFDESTCQVSVTTVAVSVSISVIVALSLILVYKFYFHLYYMILLLSGGHSTTDHSKIYDAFVIYSGEDQVWVKQELEDTLESGVPRFRLCLHYRDFRPGVPIITNIIKEGFQSSRKVIAVVSTHFLESRWCNFELEVAQSWQLLDSKASLIFVILEGVDRAALRQKLGLFRYLRRNAYLVWKDREVKRHVFLRQLKSALLEGKTWTEDELKAMLTN
ncbi:toll-like receptor 4 [Eublepharis macularius]|uniref:Toll-like receptor 4 n=1 Tax=Eublepharis macularius TaxID=481883 RepID=A0AA97KAA4_EUBMA|nr:toll-like receptor 4 [Eublepharis macularius]